MFGAEFHSACAIGRGNAWPCNLIFIADSPLEGSGFELVWGFSCQGFVCGLEPVLCSERGKPFFVPSPASRIAERAEGVKGPKR